MQIRETGKKTNRTKEKKRGEKGREKKKKI